MLLLQCCLLVQAVAIRAAYFHEPSMTTIRPRRPIVDDAFFGYSIAFTNNELVASAPRADKDGQVFSCELATHNCTRMPVPISAVTSRVHGRDNYNHNFWLGASVKADDEYLFVCAPRCTSQIPVAGKVFGTNGRCFYKDYKNSDSKFTNMLQISNKDRSINRTHNENVTDSFGWSMDIDVNGALRVGSPTIAAGRVMTYSDPSESESSPPKIFSSTNPDGFNFGYSIASGIFIKTLAKHPNPDVAIGTPYGDYGIGKVIIFDNNQKWQSDVNDPAGGVGSMFGAALCSAKLDGDTTSLLVGAPAHFSGDAKYHTGIVYIFRHKTMKIMKNVKQIKGPNKNGAFFGYAIANIGDLDKDGKDEIAIGAPYEDDGKGAVYLYAGSTLDDKSTTTSWLQRFQPETFQNLGLSLVANKYSNNACSDLAIGAPGGNSVAVYRCLTVITVDINTTVPNLQNRTDKTSFAFDVCLNAKYPSKPQNITAKFAVKVKITHPNATLTLAKLYEDFIEYEEFLDNKKNPNGCRSINVTTSENGDYEQEIEFLITAKLLDDPANSTVFDPSKATVSSHSKLWHPRSVRAAECKKEPCQPKLSVKLTTNVQNPYLIGSSSTARVDVSVRNGDGEADTAYRPCVVLTVFGGTADVHRAPPHCTVQSDTRRVCQRLRALKPNSNWDLNGEAAFDQSIEIGLEALTSDTKKIKVVAEVYNRCETAKGPDDKSSIELNLITNVDGLKIESKTDQGELVFFRKDDLKGGKKLHHTYTISNVGEINWVGLVGDLWLYKGPHITYDNLIQIYNGESERPSCAVKNANSRSDFHGLSCELGNLNRKETITVVIPITTVPNELEKVLQKSNATVKTFLRVIADKHEKEKTELTTLAFQEGKVPAWIIVVAVCVGILIVCLIGFALYECGLFRRKKKEELVHLKKEVKRKTMMLQRQSMRLTDTAREELRNRTYRELLDEAEIKEAEEGEEAEEAEEARKSQLATKNQEQSKGDNGCRTAVLNENPSGSHYDIRAHIEKTLQK